MKKFLCLIILGAGIIGCSTEPADPTSDSLTTADAKAAINEQSASVAIPDMVCAGVEAEYCVNFPQATKGNGDTKTSEVQVQLFIGDDPSTTDVVETDYYMQIASGKVDNQLCFSYTFDEAGTYDLKYQYAGSKGFTDFAVTVDDCSCEESFNYDDAGDDDPTTYTFYYTPSEDMTGAHLVFTFAQAVAVSGLDGWTNNGNATSSTEETRMDLEACHTYEWTVTLSKDCSGHSGNSNLWTDFKVNNDSKKEDLDNIRQSCPE